MNMEELDMIETRLKERFDERYKRREDCESEHSKINSKLSNDDKRIEIIQHDFCTIKKLVWTVASASISQVIISIFSMLGGN